MKVNPDLASEPEFESTVTVFPAVYGLDASTGTVPEFF
jgi:hypothetical protein